MSTSDCRARGASSPPSPTGKWTQARPASKRARRNSSRSVPATGWAARNSDTRSRSSTALTVITDSSVIARPGSAARPARHVDDLTGHEAGALAHQERHGVRDVLGLAHPAHRDLLGRPLLERLEVDAHP